MVALSTLGSLGRSQETGRALSCLKAASTIALRVFPIAPRNETELSDLFRVLLYVFV